MKRTRSSSARDKKFHLTNLLVNLVSLSLDPQIHYIVRWLAGLEEKTWIGNTTVLDLVSTGAVLGLNLVAFVAWRSNETDRRTIFSQFCCISILTALAIMLLVLRAIEILPG